MRPLTEETLRRARALLVRGWCQDAYAIDSGGHEVEPNARNAVAWCAAGAVRRLLPRSSASDVENALEQALRISGTDVSDWNDKLGRRKADILARFTSAIRRAGRRSTKSPTGASR